MRLVNVNNLVLQFDVEDDVEVTEEMVKAYIDLLNGTMSNMYRTSNPQLTELGSMPMKIVVVEFE